MGWKKCITLQPFPYLTIPQWFHLERLQLSEFEVGQDDYILFENFRVKEFPQPKSKHSNGLYTNNWNSERHSISSLHICHNKHPCLIRWGRIQLSPLVRSMKRERQWFMGRSKMWDRSFLQRQWFDKRPSDGSDPPSFFNTVNALSIGPLGKQQLYVWLPIQIDI